MTVAVAAGALVIGSTVYDRHSNDGADIDPPQSPTIDAAGRIANGIGGGMTIEQTLRPQVVALTRSWSSQLPSLSKGERLVAERAAQEAERAAQAQRAAEAERAAQEAGRAKPPPLAPPPASAPAPAPRYVAPAVGRLTSVYGMRWGTMHWGIDIANSIGTPIVAPTAGVVVESGPASGFGLWVRIRHADGTITVYGHIDRSLVRAGQQVKTGQQIATMGNRGDSTGPHLHFEVWTPSGVKINPLTWLRSHGVAI